MGVSPGRVSGFEPEKKQNNMQQARHRKPSEVLPGCEDDAGKSKATVHRMPGSIPRAMEPLVVAHCTGPCMARVGQTGMWATACVQRECVGFAAGLAVSLLLLSVYRACLGERLVCLRLWPWALRETPKVFGS